MYAREFILVSVKSIVGIVGLDFGFDSWCVVFAVGFGHDLVSSIGLVNGSGIDLVTEIGVDRSLDLLELVYPLLAILLRLVAVVV